MTVGAPGTQGAGKTGMQGMGVSVNTPWAAAVAAAVAAATAGLAMLLHGPKGWMFTMGLLSMMLAANWLLVFILFSGSTPRSLGLEPKVQTS